MGKGGHYTLVDQEVASNDYPTIVFHDYEEQYDRIKLLPSLSFFFDLSTVGTMTLESSRVAALQDLGPRALVGAASGDARPSFVTGALGSIDGVSFDGTNGIGVDDMFTGASRISIFAAVLVVPPDSASRIIATDADVASGNFYVTNNHVRMASGDVSKEVLDIGAEVHFLEWAANYGAVSDSNPLGRTLSVAADGSDWVTATMNVSRTAPNGKGNIGRNTDAIETGKFSGNIGFLIGLREDVRNNEAVRELIYDYFLRRYQIAA